MKVVFTASGMFICASALRTAATAVPSATPLARLNETVEAGNWPTWVTSSGAVRSSTVAMADSGTFVPELDCK